MMLLLWLLMLKVKENIIYKYKKAPFLGGAKILG
jgi:hypothetical protein